MSNQTWKYVGAHDAVDIPGVGTVRRGEPFTTSLNLDGRSDFEPQPSDRTTALKRLGVNQLRDLATEAGIDPAGLSKPALIAAITEKES